MESATLLVRLLDSSDTEKEWSPSMASSSIVEISTHTSELSVAEISKVTEKITQGRIKSSFCTGGDKMLT